MESRRTQELPYFEAAISIGSNYFSIYYAILLHDGQYKPHMHELTSISYL